MAVEHAAADHHGPLAVALAVAPADDAAEQGAPEGLLLADELARQIGGITAQGRGGMKLAGQGEHRCPLPLSRPAMGVPRCQRVSVLISEG